MQWTRLRQDLAEATDKMWDDLFGRAVPKLKP
jgi:hypothetical protein